MIENSRWDKEKMFFLTKTEQVEITSFEELFNCGNQCPIDHNVEVDRFGRNLIDQSFVHLCDMIYLYLSCKADSFKSLSCKRVGDKYAVCLLLRDETLEMELNEMLAEIVKRNKAGIAGNRAYVVTTSFTRTGDASVS
jgi:hypothetical protein